MPVDGAEAADDEDMDAAGAEASHPAEADEGDGRRRRRRGRRGGRRNRRGMEGQASHEPHEAPSPVEQPPHEAGDTFTVAHEHAVPVEPELVTAVADFGGPPLPEPQPQAGEAPAPEAPPRRRSTVREPVSFTSNGGGGSEAPAPVGSARSADETALPPAADVAATDAAERPRRTGWWAKRLLGDRG